MHYRPVVMEFVILSQQFLAKILNILLKVVYHQICSWAIIKLLWVHCIQFGKGSHLRWKNTLQPGKEDRREPRTVILGSSFNGYENIFCQNTFLVSFLAIHRHELAMERAGRRNWRIFTSILGRACSQVGKILIFSY